MPQLTHHLRHSILVALGLTTPLHGCISAPEPPHDLDTVENSAVDIVELESASPRSVESASIDRNSPETPERGLVETTLQPPQPSSKAPVDPMPDPSLILGLLNEPSLDEGSGSLDNPEALKLVHGRPLQIDGFFRTAKAVHQPDWAHSVAGEFEELNPSERSKVAQGWLEAGLVEHASIASFARFSLQLIALGAPPDLIRDAALAQADEVLHARHCFSIASELAKHSVGPGPINLKDLWTHPPTPKQVLLETLNEGCINETLAAAEAAWLAERAQSAVLQQVLVRIARDESRHAALAWRSVQWLLQAFPELRSTARSAFQDSLQPSVAPLQASRDHWMAAYGIMPAAERAKLRQNTLVGVVASCANSLLHETQPSPLNAANESRL